MPRNRVALLALTSALLGCAALLATAQVRQFRTAAAAESTAPYSSEEEWIAGETARAVIEMAEHGPRRHWLHLVLRWFDRYGADLRSARTLSSGDGPPVIELSFANRSVTVRLEPYAWAPEAYRHLALSAVASASSDARHDDPALIEALLDIGPDVLRVENARVSARLSTDFGNPSLHESAALLQAAFALREASGSFYDVRRTLSRITAHLVMADARRRGSRTTQGRLAEAALLALSGRQREAIAHLDNLSATAADEATRAWIRALRMRITSDWRLVNAAAPASTLERLEQISAMARTTGRVVKSDTADETAPDWGWRRLEHGHTVGQGNRLAMATWLATYVEALRSFDLPVDEMQPRGLAAALQRTPALSCVLRTAAGTRIMVIDDGLLAAFYERHLAYASERVLRHYGWMLRLPREAEQLRTVFREALRDVPLLDVARRRAALDENEYRSSLQAMALLVRRDPSRVTFENWAHSARWPPKGVEQAGTLPIETSWYTRRFPWGTMYDARRLTLLQAEDPEIARTIEGLHQLSPWNVDVVEKRTFVRCRGRCKEAQLSELYGPLAEYVTRFGVELAYTSGNRARERLRSICDFDGNSCWRLADWLLSRDRFAAAADTFEEYMRRAEDPVDMSHRVHWLAQYYLEQAQPAEALRVASTAAEAGSRSGMRMLGDHLYRTGDFERAKRLYRDIRERYDAGEDLLAFYIREARRLGRDPEDGEYIELVGRYFPQGLHRADTARLVAAPTTGLCVKKPQFWQRRAGFRDGDVVVAADGIQLATAEQWSILYEASFDHQMRVIVWRDGKYREIVAPFRKYQYGLDLRPYQAASAPEVVASR